MIRHWTSITSCLALAICLVSVALWIVSDETIASRDSYTIPGTIRYRFTIRNTTNTVVTGAQLKTFAPVIQTAYQWCDAVESSSAFETIHDEIGNQMLVFPLKPIPPFGSRIITVTAHLLFSEEPELILSTDRKFYLDAEETIQTDAPQIQELAANLRQDGTMETARACFDWVASNLEYVGYRSTALGALHALTNHKGDCTEFMSLFVALCRANTIPARCMGGYIRSGSSLMKAADYHNWAEFMDNRRWWAADPQRRRFQVPGGAMVAMQILGRHSDLSAGLQRHGVTGTGLSVTMD
ncbi:MAG: transglutaminase-like domain-containing protein [Pseudomonadota bacterium]